LNLAILFYFILFYSLFFIFLNKHEDTFEGICNLLTLTL
jgi:hypothetical protein